jgi:hypothetical protein
LSEPSPPSPPPDPPRRLWDNPWIRRLPLLAVAALGFFYFLPKVPHEVEIAYDLGRAGNGLEQVDIELIDDAGKRVHRTVLRGELARHPLQRLKLAKGGYRAELKLDYPDRVDHRTRSFEVTDADRLDVDVEQP